MVRRCLAVAAIACALFGWVHPGAAADRAHTTRATVLRASPTLFSPSQGVIPTGSHVALLRCDTSWCLVRYGVRRGYIASRYLEADTLSATSPSGRGYINRSGNWVPSPTRTRDGSPPPGACAQCCDGTY